MGFKKAPPHLNKTSAVRPHETEMSIIRIVINMDQEEHYRNIGWTRELDFCIKCPNCETENYFYNDPPDKCDTCGFRFKSEDE